MSEKKKSLSLSTIVLLIITAFSVLSSGTLGTILTIQSVTRMKNMVKNKSIEMACTAASLLDGDSLKGIKKEDKDSEAYQNCFTTLDAFKNNNEGTSGELAFIYCCRSIGNNNFEFTIDPSDDPAEFGEYLEWTEALESANNGVAAFDTKPYTDRWGTFYSAYAPVFDSNHEVIMIVGIDIWADWYNSMIWSSSRSIIIVSAAAMASGIFLGLLVNARIRKRFKVLISDFNELENDIQTLITDIQEPIEGNKTTKPTKISGDQTTQLKEQINIAQKEIKEYIIYMKKQAYIDALSRVGNRTAYVEMINQLDLSSPFAVIIYDINILKYINDTYGHDSGDKAISIFGNILKSVFDEKSIFRIGGDEFVIVLTNVYEETVMDLYNTANKAIEAVSEKKNLKYELSASKGIAFFNPQKDKSYKDVFKRADKNMYEDKRKFHKEHPNYEEYKQ